MPAPDGFTWTQRKNGDIVISHRGRQATTLRGQRAVEFVESVDSHDGDSPTSLADQELMARLTGNYKRGNERTARNHPRNRGRR